MNVQPTDPRIGTLSSGVCYCYDRGYDCEPFYGTLAACESVLAHADLMEKQSRIDWEVFTGASASDWKPN